MIKFTNSRVPFNLKRASSPKCLWGSKMLYSGAVALGTRSMSMVSPYLLAMIRKSCKIPRNQNISYQALKCWQISPFFWFWYSRLFVLCLVPESGRTTQISSLTTTLKMRLAKESFQTHPHANGLIIWTFRKPRCSRSSVLGSSFSLISYQYPSLCLSSWSNSGKRCLWIKMLACTTSIKTCKWEPNQVISMSSLAKLNTFSPTKQEHWLAISWNSKSSRQGHKVMVPVLNQRRHRKIMCPFSTKTWKPFWTALIRCTVRH